MPDRSSDDSYSEQETQRRRDAVDGQHAAEAPLSEMKVGKSNGKTKKSRAGKLKP
jgi:hypothetical protein